MGVSLIPVFSKKVGRKADEYPALGDGLGRLDKALGRAGLPPLGQFVSMDPAEWADMDPDDPDAEGLPPLRWFAPADGLAAVDAAIAALQAKPKMVSWSADAVDELTRLRAELEAAVRKRAEFRFEICD